MCQRETPYEYVCTSICVLEVEIDFVCLSVHGCGYMCVLVLGAVCAHACVCREFYVPTPGPGGYDEGLKGNPRLDGGGGGGLSLLPGGSPWRSRASRVSALMRKHSDLLCICTGK